MISLHYKKSVQINLRLALIASCSTPEEGIAAFRADIPGFFILNPFFRTDLAPIGDSPQNNLFPDTHGEIFNMLAGEFIALVASGVPFLPCAGPDLALPAMHKPFIR